MSNLTNYCDRIIRYAFYGLFFLVPLFFTSNTSELFELNKMWLTWGLAIIIMGAWLTKMIAERKFFIQRTPLDIPILLFLISQLISTFLSLDQRISFWGYYSRFNGGFLSLLTYTLLYYAFVSNETVRYVTRYIWITLLGAVIVALWGLPSHFGYDPTCLVFRGTFDTSCWTESFKPTIRIFSMLGQPAWMAAYMAALLPLVMAFFIKKKEEFNGSVLTGFTNWKVLGLFLMAIIFYLDLLFTNTRAGFLGFWGANILFWISVFLLRIVPKRKFVAYLLIFNSIFLISNFLIGTPVAQLDKFTLKNLSAKPVATKQSTSPTSQSNQSAALLDTGITDSGNIRLLVWEGALASWKAHPLFGTGVETFAFAYYKTRPAAHNMTSEWDYLYNKAHNEYLNYLTTTGAVGLGTHLLLLGLFLFLALKKLLELIRLREDKPPVENVLLLSALPAAFVSIIVTNFFGFSVVIMNIFLYFFPLWFLILSGMITLNKGFSFTVKGDKKTGLSMYQWSAITGIFLISLILLFQLINFWKADTSYALGNNYDKAGAYDAAYPELAKAVSQRPAEPVFKDEFSINLATLATALIQNGNATDGARLAQQAVTLSDEVTNAHPNNVVYWKTRVRIFYLLAQIDKRYYENALTAVQKAQNLAPTDAKISYNVGVLYGQNGEYDKAIKELSHTIKLKPNYRDAYYARALFYRQESESAFGANKTDLQNKAIDDLKFTLQKIDPSDKEARKVLESWGVFL